tara:strand:- start:48 stop:518 length:471 start_codon:yes stop_codon:yes gene_type:complete
MQYVAKLEEIFEGHEFQNVSYVNDLCDTIDMDGMINIMLPNSVFDNPDNEEFTWFTIRDAYDNHIESATFKTFDDMVEFIKNKLLIGMVGNDIGYWFLGTKETHKGVAISNPNRCVDGRYEIYQDFNKSHEEYYGDVFLRACRRIEFTLEAHQDTY